MAKTKIKAAETTAAPAAETPAAVAEAPKEAAAREDTYSVEELKAASKEVFKVPSEVTGAALRNVKTPISVSEAKALIEAFMNNGWRLFYW